jgi:hypothetical protein
VVKVSTAGQKRLRTRRGMIELTLPSLPGQCEPGATVPVGAVLPSLGRTARGGIADESAHKGADHMKYVDERTATFDTDALGFPSIGGCHAIVYLTTRGLYGFHLLGGVSAPHKFAVAFAEYVSKTRLAGESGLLLYGCTHVTTQRGYPGEPRFAWRDELRCFARALDGPASIRGVDLSRFNQDFRRSTYVEFRNKGGSCEILVRLMDEGERALKGKSDATLFAPIGVSLLPSMVSVGIAAGTLQRMTPELV